jgi:Carbohydrate-selective porin, OprB family/S-layer homology domain
MVKQIDWWLVSLGSLTIVAYAQPRAAGEVGLPSHGGPIAGQSAVVSPPLSPPLPPINLPPVVPLDPVLGGEEPAADPMDQITSVAQLKDVRPSDWAFQALQTLVERYGIIAGYPDGTFRGNRAMTRNEFAAGLAAVFTKLEEILLVNPNDGTARNDLATLRRLQNAYGLAATDLSQRMTKLEQRNTDLESRNFSPTTKLHIQSLQIFTDGNGSSARLVFRTRLDLNTSFDGRDRLVTQLQGGNNENDAVGIAQIRNQPFNLLGTNGLIADGGGIDGVGVPRSLQVRKLYYQFEPTANLQVAIGTALPPSDFIDRNTFANQSGLNFLSSFFANNPLIIQNQIDRPGGAGVAVMWQVQDQLRLRALYAAADASNPTQGLFDNRKQASLEAEYDLRKNLKLRLQYTNAVINGSSINAGGINAEWAIDRQFAVFGRYGLGTYRGFNTDLGRDLNLDPKTWSTGFVVRNFLIPGSKAGFAVGQPFVEKSLNGATQTNFEGYFGLALNDRINFIPTFMAVSNPNNRRAATIFQWALRMVFEF